MLTFALLCTGSSFAQTAEDVASAADSVLRELAAQRRLPSQARVPPEEPPIVNLRRLPPRPPEDEGKLPPSAPWGTVLKMLLWMGAICSVVFLIAYAMERLPGFRRRIVGSPSEEEAVDIPSGTSAQAEPLSAADALAAAGQYSEAMHRILVDLVAILRKRSDDDVSDGATSRELLHLLRLDERGRSAFREIVFRVEHAWFGDRPATSADYDVVRERFYLVTGSRQEAA